MKIRSLAAISAAIGFIGVTPAAAERYFSGSAAFSFLRNSDNEGAFAGPFTTGAGTLIPAGTVLPDGTSVGWTTDFSSGFALAAAVGRRFGPLRGEVELAYQRNGVDTHFGVTAGGLTIDGEDAGILITGSPNLGVTVGDLVADGQGRLRTVYAMANAFYDINVGGPIRPYLGGGAGLAFANVDYSPSGVGIINDGGVNFAWQVMAGASWAVTRRSEIFGGYRYRSAGDVSVEADLFAADFDVQNRGSILEAGLRLTF